MTIQQEEQCYCKEWKKAGLEQPDLYCPVHKHKEEQMKKTTDGSKNGDSGAGGWGGRYGGAGETATIYVESKQKPWEIEFDLFLGIAPKGTLKYEKSQFIKCFIQSLLDSQRKQVKEEVCNDLIQTFSKYKNEPMTGNVVILEIKALRDMNL
jgi:hypothetical protein